MQERKDDFQSRREHLKHMSDQELRTYFLELSEKIVDPLVDLAYNHTSKSIERSILLRMGFSSIEAKAIVDIIAEKNLLSKGAGQCVYVFSQHKQIPIHVAGLVLAEGNGFDYLMEYFKIYE